MYAYMYVCMYVYMYVYICVWIYVCHRVLCKSEDSLQASTFPFHHMGPMD